MRIPVELVANPASVRSEQPRAAPNWNGCALLRWRADRWMAESQKSERPHDECRRPDLYPQCGEDEYLYTRAALSSKEEKSNALLCRDVLMSNAQQMPVRPILLYAWLSDR